MRRPGRAYAVVGLLAGVIVCVSAIVFVQRPSPVARRPFHSLPVSSQRPATHRGGAHGPPVRREPRGPRGRRHGARRRHGNHHPLPCDAARRPRNGEPSHVASAVHHLARRPWSRLSAAPRRDDGWPNLLWLGLARHRRGAALAFQARGPGVGLRVLRVVAIVGPRRPPDGLLRGADGAGARAAAPGRLAHGGHNRGAPPRRRGERRHGAADARVPRSGSRRALLHGDHARHCRWGHADAAGYPERQPGAFNYVERRLGQLRHAHDQAGAHDLRRVVDLRVPSARHAPDAHRGAAQPIWPRRSPRRSLARIVYDALSLRVHHTRRPRQPSHVYGAIYCALLVDSRCVASYYILTT